MSLDFNAYLCRASFPSLAALREYLQRAGDRVAIDEDVDFSTGSGWVNVRLDGTPTGFEIYSGEINDVDRARYRDLLQSDNQPDQYLAILESCDFDLNFHCNGVQEIVAARLVMTAIATLAQGWLSDPQQGTRIRLGQPPSFRARQSFGNPYAPMGFGAYTVTINLDDTVELVHEQAGKRRRWLARAEPALATALEAGLAAANFPAPPNVNSAPPGTASFEIEVARADGSIDSVSGFPSPNYRDVSFVFTHLVAQMSGDAFFGFTIPVETRYVTDAKEVET